MIHWYLVDSVWHQTTKHLLMRNYLCLGVFQRRPIRNVWCNDHWPYVMNGRRSLSFIQLNRLTKTPADFGNAIEFGLRVLFESSLVVPFCMRIIDDEAKLLCASSHILLLVARLLGHEACPRITSLQNFLTHEDGWANKQGWVPYVHIDLNQTQFQHVPRETEKFCVAVCDVRVSLQKSKCGREREIEIQTL